MVIGTIYLNFKFKVPYIKEMINPKEKLMKRWEQKLITSNDLEDEIKSYFKMTKQSVNKMNYTQTLP